MGTNFRNIADSWLQFVLSVIIFAVFVGIAVLIAPLFIDYVNEQWNDEFYKYILMAAVSGVVLHFLTIVIFAFLDNGNKATAWYVALVINILCALSFFIFFLLKNPEGNEESLVLIVSGCMFILMYVASYIISTLFMPQRFANPLASKIFM